MILLKRLERETNTVQAYSIIGETSCGVSLDLTGMICYNLDSDVAFLEREEVEGLAKKQVEIWTGLTVRSIQVRRWKLLSMQFFDYHDESMIENRVGDYISEMKLLGAQSLSLIHI